MRSSTSSFAGLLLIGAVMAAGCHHDNPNSGSPPPAADAPTTMPTPSGNMLMPGPTTMPVPSAKQTTVTLPSAPAPAEKDLTHVLTKDEPFFVNEPATTATPAATLKEGSKVLVVIPGAQYSQVITDTGLTGYTMTQGLKPLGK